MPNVTFGWPNFAYTDDRYNLGRLRFTNPPVKRRRKPVNGYWLSLLTTRGRRT